MRKSQHGGKPQSPLDSLPVFVYPDAMNRCATACFLLCTTLLTSSCLQQQQPQQQEEQTEKSTQPRVVPPLHLGAVHQVYPEQGFALLRIIGPMPAPGATLITHPANGSTERIGNLCISAQRPSRDGIVAADIRSGTMVKGDRVFLYRNISQNTSDDVIAAERPAELPGAEESAAGEPLNNLHAGEGPEEETFSFEDAPALDAGEAEHEVSTTVLPLSVPAAPGSDPGAPGVPAKAPDYLDSIPDNIDDWDSL